MREGKGEGREERVREGKGEGRKGDKKRKKKDFLHVS